MPIFKPKHDKIVKIKFLRSYGYNTIGSVREYAKRKAKPLIEKGIAELFSGKIKVAEVATAKPPAEMAVAPPVVVEKTEVESPAKDDKKSKGEKAGGK